MPTGSPPIVEPVGKLMAVPVAVITASPRYIELPLR
jgi:hypothetical protein